MTTKKELDPIDKYLDAILRASGTTLANFETSAGALQGMRAALLAAVAELVPAGAASANHFPGAAKMVVELSDEQIKAILLAAGYTTKPAAPQPPAAQPAPDHFPDAAKMMAGDAAMKTAMIDGSQLWVRQVDARAALAAKDAELAVSAQLIRNLESRNSGLATDLAAARQHLPAHAPAFSTVSAGKLAELQAKGFLITGYSIEKIECGQVTRGFITHGGMVGWWVPDAGAQAGPALLTKNQIHLALDAAGVMPDGLTLEREVKAARAIEAAVHAANPVLAQQHARYRWLLARSVETLLNGPNPASWGACVDAEKIAEADAIVAKVVGQEGGAS